MKYIIVLLLIVMSIQNTSAQSCCASGPTASFAALTTSKKFRSAHAEPLPFHLAEQRGALIHFACSDGTDGSAYMLKASTPTDKYVFMIHEWWGLNDYIKLEAEKLQSELGNVNVLALDLYDGKVATTRELAAKYMSSANETRIRAIINGAIQHVGSSAKVCTVGWCFGGGWSLQTTLMLGKQAAGCVMYYGMPESDEKKLMTLNVPVLFIHANKDAWITTEIVTAFEQRLKRLSKNIVVKSYTADHAFANPSNPLYKKTDAEDAHSHCVTFMREQLQ